MLKAELNQESIPSASRLSVGEVNNVLYQIDSKLTVKQNGVVSIAFVSEQRIRELNRDYRGKDTVTDVLAFPLQDNSGEENTIGEVLVCYKQAERQSTERGHSTKQELIDLIIHGTLHVLGYDHETKEDAEIMLPLQKKIYDAVI